MKTVKMNTLRKVTLIVIAILVSASITFASGQDEVKQNSLSYNLEKGSVEISYLSIQDPNESEMLTLSTIEPAHFELSKNMNVNGTHIEKGEYEVSLIEFENGLGFNFHSLDSRKRSDVQVALLAENDSYSEWLGYSLEVVEDDKIVGEFNWKDNKYTFSMEIALSNTIFSYLEKEENENTSDWVDYYQAAIYAYKNNIDLEESYKWAQKALRSDENEYTTRLNRMYLESFDGNTDAQQLSALQD
jgi:hypothetical protein